MRLPALNVDATTLDTLESPFVVVQLNNKVLQFKAWDEVKGHYREQASRTQIGAFGARCFVFYDDNWSEVEGPSQLN